MRVVRGSLDALETAALVAVLAMAPDGGAAPRPHTATRALWRPVAAQWEPGWRRPL